MEGRQLAGRLDKGYLFRGEEGEDGLAELTPRELEVLTLIGVGADNSDIAQMLYISKRTVETHVHRIYAKLGLKGRTQAVLYALKRGLVRDVI